MFREEPRVKSALASGGRWREVEFLEVSAAPLLESRGGCWSSSW